MDNTPNIITNRFSAIANNYHRFRPSPPDDLIFTILGLSKKPFPDLVCDIGCGTGLSTFLWNNKAKNVIGIDPSSEMLEVAEENNIYSNVRLLKGEAYKTPLDDSSVDIVTFSSSIHWCEPESTLKEIARILRSGGIFAAFGPQIPPLLIDNWEISNEIKSFLNFARDIDSSDDGSPPLQKWKWDTIRNTVNNCLIFGYTDELCFGSIVEWNSDNLLGWLLSFSYVSHQLNRNNLSIQKAFYNLEDYILKNTGYDYFRLLLSYRLILGIK